MKYTPIDLKLLKDYIELDENIPQKFRWKKRPSNRIKVGDPVGTKHLDKNDRVYYGFTLHGTHYLVHRVYFAFKNGYDPGDKDVDHADHNYENNGKFRLSTRSENIANSKPKQGKYKGIWYAKHAKKYRASITVDYKTIHLGYFHSQEEAAIAYNEAAVKYFGEFAYLNVIPHKYCHQPEQRPNPPA